MKYIKESIYKSIAYFFFPTYIATGLLFVTITYISIYKTNLHFGTLNSTILETAEALMVVLLRVMKFYIYIDTRVRGRYALL